MSVACGTGRDAPAPVVAVGGGVASGKSTLARALAERLDASHLEGDRVRVELGGNDPSRGLDEDFEERVYAELLRRARHALDGGSPVVLDACFPRASQREAARGLARERGAPFVFVEVRVSPEVRRARLREREASRGESGWPEIARRLDERWEPVAEFPAAQRLIVDGAGTVTDCLKRVEETIATAPAAERHTEPG